MSSVLLINGSPHKEGNTFAALSEVARRLGEQGVGAEIAWIGTKPVRGCIACGTCSQTGSGRCVFDDDVCNVMIDRMNAADGLVVGSPTYYGVPTGSLISLIQRMCYSGARMQNKPAAAVAVCRRGGATAAFQTLQMPFQMMNMPIVTSQYWNIVYGLRPGEASLDAEGLQTMRTLADNMAWMLKSLASQPAPVREPWIPTHFIK